MAEEAAADRGTDGDHRWRFAPAEWLKAAVTATTALGVVTYAVLRVDYGIFYDRFGLKPEDVGLGQAELVSQSVAGVVLILGVLFFELVLLGGAGLVLGLLVREYLRLLSDTARRYGNLAAILSTSVLAGAILGQLIGATAAGPWLLVAVGPVALWFLWRVSRGPVAAGALMFGGMGLVVFVLSVAFALSPQWTVVGFVGCMALATISNRWSSRRSRHTVEVSEGDPSTEVSAGPGPATPAAAPPDKTSDVGEASPSDVRQPQRGRSRTIRRVVLVVAVTVTVALTETLLALSAVSDANYVRSGHAVEPTMLGIPLVSWGARAVDVTWQGDPPAGGTALLGHCLLYLGQDGGAVLLYDHDAGRTIRLSSGAVVLSIRPSANYERVCPR